jgi:hypothetical protein
MKAVRALMLVLALSVCAYAGNIPNDGRPEPPPTTSTATEESNTDSGDVGGDIETTTEDADITTDVALNLIGAVLALF